MTESNTPRRRRGGAMRIPRTRGALSGFLLIVLGAWGALIPFIGPYFKYGFSTGTWQWTTGRLWLEVVPGVAAILGGLILLTTANRASAVFGGWLASAAGAWFVVGPVVSPLWGGADADIGAPVGGPKRQVVEQLGFFYGLGVVILFLAAHAAGRVTVRSVRDLEAVDRHTDAAEPVGAEEHRRGFGRGKPRRDQAEREESRRAAGGAETRREEVAREEPRAAGRDTGAGGPGNTTVGGRSGATSLSDEERRSGSSGTRER